MSNSVTARQTTDSPARESHSSGIRGLVRRHAILTFFVLAFVFSQAPTLLWPHTLSPLGPIMAALVVVPLAGGRAALSDFWRACIRWRVGVRWYALAIGLPVAITLSALALTAASGANVDRSAMPPLSELVPTIIACFIMVGIGEELAWRGVALPRLMAGRSLLSAAIILGLVHAVWHWPLVGGEMTYNQVAPVAIAIVAFSLFTAWMYSRSSGSLLLPALAHTTVNSVSYYVFSMVSGSAETEMYWIWAAGWAIAGTVAALAMRDRSAASSQASVRSPVAVLP